MNTDKNKYKNNILYLLIILLNTINKILSVVLPYENLKSINKNI